MIVTASAVTTVIQHIQVSGRAPRCVDSALRDPTNRASIQQEVKTWHFSKIVKTKG